MSTRKKSTRVSKATAKKKELDEISSEEEEEVLEEQPEKTKKGGKRKPAADKEDEEKPTKKAKGKGKGKAKDEDEEKKPSKGKGKEAAVAEDEDDEGSADVATSSSSSSLPTDFSLPKKDTNHIKISSWNVAGFKAVMKKGFVAYLSQEDPDIICLQETKIDEQLALKEKLPSHYHAYFYHSTSKKGYSGTGLLSKIKPIVVTRGLDIKEHDDEGRCLTAEYEKFYLVTTYTPNSSKGLVNLDYRVNKWDVDFLKYIKKLEEKKPVVWCGDLNVAHLEIDLKNPKTNRKTAGFTQEERDSFSKILNSGFVDTFRHFYPKQENAYTFWSFMGGARAKDVGWRLDYFIVSKDFMPSVVDTCIRKYVTGSDHAPIVLLLKK